MLSKFPDPTAGLFVTALAFLTKPEVKAFIAAHENDDIPALALKKPPADDWPYALVLDQIKARRKAALKCPEFLNAHPDLIMPPADVIEQASSDQTANYKASLVSGTTFADLTAGAGIDSLALAQRFKQGQLIDQDPHSAAILAHNMACLNQTHLAVHLANAEDFAKTLPPVDLVYLDPQRRKAGRKGLFRLQDASPDITVLLPALAEKAQQIMLKASPMLDIDFALKTLGNVAQVHILEWQGECKELVFLITPDSVVPTDSVRICAIRLNEKGVAEKHMAFTRAEEKQAACDYGPPGRFLFDPGPAFHKSGAFKTLGGRFGLRKLHPQTHLYTSDSPCPDFPGRSFEIAAVTKAERKALGLEKANLAIRNFPMDVESLKKKLGLKDGGKDTVFACTLADGKKALIRARRHD